MEKELNIIHMEKLNTKVILLMVNMQNFKIYIKKYSSLNHLKNNLRNGKGTLYYSNGSIKYEGDFINDKFGGNGKYIWENGKYYIGQCKNGLRNGKGIEYYSNGNIKKNGNWINDEFVGN